MLKFLSSFRRDEKGVTLVEYGIALVLAITVGGFALSSLGTATSGQMTTAKGLMGTVAPTE